MTPRAFSVYALFCAAVGTQYTSDAWACSGLSCDPSRISTAPPHGAIVPANAPALLVETGWWGEPQVLTLDGGDAGAPSTTSESGQRGSLLLKLSEPLTAGTTYHLQVANQCTAFGDAGVTRHEQTVTFSAGPASPLPSSVGSVQVAYSTARLGGRSGYNKDGQTIGFGPYARVAVAQITIRPSPELEAYLPLTRFSTYVDGVLWGESHYGHGTASYEAAPDEVTHRDFTRVFISCTRDGYNGSCEPSGLAAGVHEVELRAHVAGTSNPPEPLRFQITLSCADGGAPDGAALDAAGSDQPHGDTNREDPGLLTEDASVETRAVEGRDAGCTVVGPVPRGRVVMLAAFVLAISCAFSRRPGR